MTRVREMEEPSRRWFDRGFSAGSSWESPGERRLLWVQLARAWRCSLVVS